MANFRLDAKHLFLTYPRCELTKEQALEQLKNKTIDIKHYVIGRELHEDGHPHLHVYLALNRKKNTQNPAFYDLRQDATVYHGNYQAARDIADVMKYCKKDGDFIQSDGIEEPEDKMDYGEIIKTANTAQEYMALVEKHYPRDISLNYDKLMSFANQRFPPVVEEYQPPYRRDQFDIPEEISDWVSTFIGMYDSVYGCELI